MPSIFLIGFMAAGKSRVAEHLSQILNMSHVDLDTLIAEEAGQSVAQIFASEGQAEFRKRESRVLRAQAAQPGAKIIATGGGTPCHADNLAYMRDSGTVVHLSTSLATSLQRAADCKVKRPLLEQSASEIESLYRDRAPVYRRAQISVSTEDKTAEEVATSISLALASTSAIAQDVSGRASVVALGNRSYPIVVEAGCLADLGEALCAQLPRAKRVAIISDDTVFSLYGKTVADSLSKAGLDVTHATVRPGESSKTIGVFEKVCEALIAEGLDRTSVIVAVGGGVVGDLAGFVAASLYRGIALVQVPTTLLAMTDSGIGGKTGINSKQGKNLIGAFWQPSLVWADPDTLTTLSQRERRAAFGELVKYALLDEELWTLVEDLAPSVCADTLESSPELTELVRGCANLKAGIVSADERERGQRALLNLGHTLGHAIEAHAGFGKILHGEAVALGLLATCRVSHRLGICSKGLESRVAAILDSAGLDTDIDSWLTPEVLDHMGVDKKRTGSKLRFIAVHKLGDVRQRDIELIELTGLLLTD
jgi:shikimate kinase/3-dehydroquinate synthase